MNADLESISAICREISIDIERRWNPGVYLLIRAGDVVYVGQSKDVDQRVLFHVSDQRRRRRGHMKFDRILAMPTRMKDRRKIEAALIRRFAPIYNVNCGAYDGRDNSILKKLGLVPYENEKLSVDRWYSEHPHPLTGSKPNRTWAVPREKKQQLVRARRLFSAIDSLFAARAS